MVAEKNKKIIILGGIFLGFFGMTSKVMALEVKYPTVFGYSINDTSSFSQYVCYLFGLIMNLAIIIAVMVIAFGGIYYLFSLGRGKFTNEGKEWIKSGILGLLIVVCAFLIAYTINPTLTSCKLELGPLTIKPTPPSPPPTAQESTLLVYEEVPIGSLTEILLTRKTSCYAFDQEGNPIDGDTETDELEPTFLEHDRADCLLQLINGSQKKAQVIAALNSKIEELMNQCNCLGKCDPTCSYNQCYLYGSNNKQNDSGSNCYGYQFRCEGECCWDKDDNGRCKQNSSGEDCCPDGVKDQIEHGGEKTEIEVDVGGAGSGGSGGGGSGGISLPGTGSGSSCKTEKIENKGLDEFRCGGESDVTPCENLPQHVEKQITLYSKSVTAIDQTKWDELNMWQQLKYFQEKIRSWPQDSKIIEDVKVLDDARAKLASRGCYHAMPYIDLFKTYETTNQKHYTLLRAPEEFFDPVTKEPVDATKYCTGFNYNNSSCFKKCNDMCPDSSSQAMANYASCAKDDNACIKRYYNSRPCPYGDSKSSTFGACMNSCHIDCTDACETKYLGCSYDYDFCNSQCTTNGTCILDNESQCLFRTGSFQYCGANSTDPGNDSFCINNAYLCKNGSNEYSGDKDCAIPSTPTPPNQKNCGSSTTTTCYPGICPAEEAKNCNVSCANKYESMCPINDKPACYGCYNHHSGWDQQCLINNSCPQACDHCNGDANCLRNCRNYMPCRCGGAGSQTFEGCVNTCKDSCISDCEKRNKRCETTTIPNQNCALAPYSASFLRESYLRNPPGYEKCHDPYAPAKSGNVCYSSSPPTASCQEVCPETSKCSTSSMCSDCLCDKITDPNNVKNPLDLNFYNQNTSIPPMHGPLICGWPIMRSPGNVGNEGYKTEKTPVLAYEIVGPQCNGLSHNDDPLTFYCERNFWDNQNDGKNNSTPLGEERIVNLEREGEIPVGKTVDEAKSWANWLINEPPIIVNDIQVILKQMKEKVGDAIYQDNGVENYCKCNAEFEKNDEPVCKTNCQFWLITIKAVTFCGCFFTPCAGNPCEQELKYTSKLWNDIKPLKKDFISFYTDMIKEPRSDIMKKLTYSRQTMNNCSIQNTAYGPETRVLNCSRVLDEGIWPFNTKDNFCYGRKSDESLTDNWFCTQQWGENVKQNNNPIFNK